MFRSSHRPRLIPLQRSALEQLCQRDVRVRLVHDAAMHADLAESGRSRDRLLRDDPGTPARSSVRDRTRRRAHVFAIHANDERNERLRAREGCQKDLTLVVNCRICKIDKPDVVRPGGKKPLPQIRGIEDGWNVVSLAARAMRDDGGWGVIRTLPVDAWSYRPSLEP